MNNEYDELIRQIFEKPFKKMLYSVYNKADEEKYTYCLDKNGYNSDFDNLEFIVLDTDGMNKNLFFGFKHYVEDTLQQGKAIIGILTIDSKVGKVLVAIKPKDVNVGDFLHV